jgi:hypothetical protein
MPQAKSRSVLLPWIIGLAVIAVVDVIVAMRMFATDCPAPGLVEGIVVIVIPVVYLALAYITFKSQD